MRSNFCVLSKCVFQWKILTGHRTAQGSISCAPLIHIHPQSKCTIPALACFKPCIYLTKFVVFSELLYAAYLHSFPQLLSPLGLLLLGKTPRKRHLVPAFYGKLSANFHAYLFCIQCVSSQKIERCEITPSISELSFSQFLVLFSIIISLNNFVSHELVFIFAFEGDIVLSLG